MKEITMKESIEEVLEYVINKNTCFDEDKIFISSRHLIKAQLNFWRFFVDTIFVYYI